MIIRDARPSDAAACAAIYHPFVADTCVSLEEEPPDAAEMARRIADVQRAHAWLIAEAAGPAEDGRAAEPAGHVLGYAYGAPFRTRAGFRWTCEVSVYVAPGGRRQGAGRALYLALFDRLAALGYRRAVACMTQPNAASAGLHEAVGFTVVGTFRSVGFKHGAWRDLTFFERPLPGHDARPPSGLPSRPET